MLGEHQEVDRALRCHLEERIAAGAVTLDQRLRGERVLVHVPAARRRELAVLLQAADQEVEAALHRLLMRAELDRATAVDQRQQRETGQADVEVVIAGAAARLAATAGREALRAEAAVRRLMAHQPVERLSHRRLGLPAAPQPSRQREALLGREDLDRRIG
jgi:hypothetical protein